MDGFSILDPLAWDPEAIKLHPAYTAGNAAAWLSKTGAAASTNHYLTGRLYVSKSGWLLLSVPNALVRGVFDAMNVPGAELPHAGKLNVPNTKPELLNAHISVMTADEVQQVGADKINERGHHFHYALGPVKEITPKNIDGISKVWAIQVASPELAALRKTYGLSALPNDDHPFHITVAVRRKNVLGANEVAKIDGTRGEIKAAADITKLAPKWSDRAHLLAALPKHLSDTQTALSTPNGNVDKEMTDLALIAHAWLKSQKQKELLATRLKKFQETAAYPSLAPPQQADNAAQVELKAAAAEQLPWRERAEVYARDPNTGKLYGGKWDNDGTFALPGGGIDPGEDPATAALRELEEETGIKATNARVLPIPTVDTPWTDKMRAEKAKHGRGNFAGSRTHFVAADIVKHPKRKNLDYWAAVDRGYYDPAEALAIMQGVKKYNAPNVANARMAALNYLIAEAAKKQAAVKDILPGGAADHAPDSQFPPKALAEGKQHEREHTTDDEIAEEIAKDHLSEDPAYYKKVEAIEKGANSVYLNQAMQMFNPAAMNTTIPYDHTKPVFENIRNQLAEVKRRGDFMLQTRRNHDIWRAQLDPNYRYQRAIQAFRGQLPQPSVTDQLFERYGDGVLNMLPQGKK